jgi:hypothetical protein
VDRSLRFVFPLFELCLALIIAACGTGTFPPPPPPPVSVTISGASTPMNVGDNRAFTATVHNSTNQAVTWSVVESSGGTITQDGQYTAPSLPGTFHVQAVSQPIKTGSLSLTTLGSSRVCPSRDSRPRCSSISTATKRTFWITAISMQRFRLSTAIVPCIGFIAA